MQQIPQNKAPENRIERTNGRVGFIYAALVAFILLFIATMCGINAQTPVLPGQSVTPIDSSVIMTIDEFIPYFQAEQKLYKLRGLIDQHQSRTDSIQKSMLASIKILEGVVRIKDVQLLNYQQIEQLHETKVAVLRSENKQLRRQRGLFKVTSIIGSVGLVLLTIIL